MTVSLSFLAAFMWVAVMGAILHEVAHWIVWLIAGRRPRLDLWQLEVIPRAGPREVKGLDRVAAAAPYLGGLTALTVGVTTGRVLWIVLAVFMIGVPSRVDIHTIFGYVEWDSLEA